MNNRTIAAVLVALAAAAAPAPASANDALRVAGEIVKQGGVNMGDGVAGLRVLAGLRTLTANELLTADVGQCNPVNSGAFDPADVGHPPVTAPFSDGVFDETDLATILSAAVGGCYIAPVIGYSQSLAGTFDGAASPIAFLGGLVGSHGAFADLDGDGDRDLYVLSGEGLLREFRNNGAATPNDLVFNRFLNNAGGQGRFEISLAFGDLDADGDLDMVTGVNNLVFLRRNTGSATVPVFGAAEQIGMTAGFGARVALGDLNGDGRLDILAGHFGGAIDYFRNSGTAGSPAFTNEALATLPASGGLPIPTLVDIDNDMDLDLFVISGTFKFYRNTGTSAAPTFTEQASPFTPTNFPSHLVAGRFDGDADYDFISIGDQEPNFTYFRNTGSANAPAFADGETTVHPGGAIFDRSGTTMPRFADLVGSSAPDLVVGLEGGRIDVFPTLSLAGAPSFGAPTQLRDAEDSDAPIRDVYGFFDLDGDGDADLLGAKNDPGGPKIYVYENTSSGGMLEFRGRGYLKSGMTEIVVDTRADAYGLSFDFGDMDDDGDKDLFASTYGGGSPGFWILENTGTASLLQRFGPSVAADVRGGGVFNSIRPTVVDLDYDGDPDILHQAVGSAYMGLLVNVGDAAAPIFMLSFLQVPPPVDIFSFSSHGFTSPIDLSGDGDLDLLFGGTSGGLYLWGSRQAN